MLRIKMICGWLGAFSSIGIVLFCCTILLQESIEDLFQLDDNSLSFWAFLLSGISFLVFAAKNKFWKRESNSTRWKGLGIFHLSSTLAFTIWYVFMLNVVLVTGIHWPYNVILILWGIGILSSLIFSLLALKTSSRMVAEHLDSHELWEED